MKFVFGKQDMPTLERAQEHCWLLTNGLGGYYVGLGSFLRHPVRPKHPDGGRDRPTRQVNLIHRLSEELAAGETRTFLSTQLFADGGGPEEGYRNLSSFVWDEGPAAACCAIERTIQPGETEGTLEIVFSLDGAPKSGTKLLTKQALRQKELAPLAGADGTQYAALAERAREQLEPMESMLREGCAGFLPEVYDGLTPDPSKGCFAQAWSVGELLRVYETLEQIEKEAAGNAG